MQQHVYTIAKTCELAGISHAIICPGSRSAPLVYAFNNSNINCISVVDERSAAYIALGMAQQLNKPVAIICTSGTAVLNFFPAIAEAFYQQIPLLVLTADRPADLLNQQDGQMIMQQNVYGQHVLSSVELPCYNEGEENHVECAQIVHDAIQLVEGKLGKKGPVHINIPLREPLYPTKIGSEKILVLPKLLIAVVSNKKSLTTEQSNTLTNAWKSSTKKLIIVGQGTPNASLMNVLMTLSNHDDVVIVADVLSNQFEQNTCKLFDYLLMRADEKTSAALEPDCIISLGGPVLSKALKIWLQKCKPNFHVRINAGETQVDTYKNVTHHYHNEPSEILNLVTKIKNKTNSSYAAFWQAANVVMQQAQQRYLSKQNWSEVDAMQVVLKSIPDGVNVQIGNSSIIRYISYLGQLNPSWVVNGNRGTSGIDGCTSTAVGAALVNNRPTYLLTGDIAFLYDINALWNAPPPNLRIIVFNNQGGGIFQLIDGPKKQPQLLDFFTTPHQQSIKQIAAQKQLTYYVCDSISSLNKCNKFFTENNEPKILELTFNLTENAHAFSFFKQITI